LFFRCHAKQILATQPTPKQPLEKINTKQLATNDLSQPALVFYTSKDREPKLLK